MKQKRGKLLFAISILSLLCVLPIFSAVEINIEDTSFSPGETFRAEIIGYFIDFTQNNIFIYEGDKPRPEPVSSYLTKIKGKYYYYAILPEKSGNFSLRLDNVKIFESGKVETVSFIKNFTIESNGSSTLSIDPGYILLNEDKIDVSVKSISSNLDVSAKLGLTGEVMNFYLIKGEKKHITFDITEITLVDDAIDSFLYVNDYQIPIYIFKSFPIIGREDNDTIINDTIIYGEKNINITPEQIISKVVPGDYYKFLIYIENSGEENITLLTLTDNLNSQFQPSTIENFGVGDNILINVTVPVNSEEKYDLLGEISIKYDENTTTIPVLLEITYNESDVNNNSTTTNLLCAELGGILCEVDEECDGETIASLEGPCCDGECKIIKETSYVSVGIFLAVLLGAIVLYGYLQLKKRQKPKNPDQLLKEKRERYEKRMNLPSEEIKGSLKRS